MVARRWDELTIVVKIVLGGESVGVLVIVVPIIRIVGCVHVVLVV